MNFDLSIDNTEISDKISKWEVVWDRYAPHSLITIESKAKPLWDSLDYTEDKGTARIKVNVKADECLFLFEKKEGTEHNFKLSGRSLSALECGDHSAFFYGVWDDMYQQAGSSIAALQSMLTQTLSYTGTPLLGFAQYKTFSGYPIDCLIDAATELGCIVQGQDDGTIIVSDKYPFSPLSLATQTPTFYLTDDDILLDFTTQSEIGLKYDSVIVTPPVYDESPDIVIEDGNKNINEDWAYIRVYWPEVTTFFTADLYTSHGTLELVSSNDTATHTESVTFQDGQASVGHRISDLTSYTWHGTGGGDILWTAGQKELRTSNAVAGALATVTYEAQYNRYRLWSVSEANVFIAFRRPTVWGSRPYKITLENTDGNNPAPPVSGEGAYIPVGKVTLYDSYDKLKITGLKIAITRKVRPGMIVNLTTTDPLANGNFFIEKVTATAERVKTYYTLEIVKWSR